MSEPSTSSCPNRLAPVATNAEVIADVQEPNEDIVLNLTAPHTRYTNRYDVIEEKANGNVRVRVEIRTC